MTSWEQYLKKIYYDPSNPASFTGPDKLHRFVRKDGKCLLSKYKIRKWSQRQEPYSLERPLKGSFKRNKVIVKGIDDHPMLMPMPSSVMTQAQDILERLHSFGCHTWITSSSFYN